MAKKRKETEVLNMLRSETTHLWGAMFIVGGGGIALFLGEHNFWNNTFAALGIVFFFIFLNAYFIRRDEIVKKINEMED